MNMVILTILFIAVFAFILWRVMAGAGMPRRQEPTTTYVCPLCNEMDCECYKADDAANDPPEDPPEDLTDGTRKEKQE